MTQGIDNIWQAEAIKGELNLVPYWLLPITKSSPDTYVIQREKVLGRTGPDYWQNPIQFSYNELRSRISNFKLG